MGRSTFTTRDSVDVSLTPGVCVQPAASAEPDGTSAAAEAAVPRWEPPATRPRLPRQHASTDTQRWAAGQARSEYRIRPN